MNQFLYIIMLICRVCENLHISVTLGFRSDSHGSIINNIFLGTPRVQSFCIRRWELILSKA